LPIAIRNLWQKTLISGYRRRLEKRVDKNRRPEDASRNKGQIEKIICVEGACSSGCASLDVLTE
jgi:hypothetical protein